MDERPRRFCVVGVAGRGRSPATAATLATMTETRNEAITRNTTETRNTRRATGLEWRSIATILALAAGAACGGTSCGGGSSSTKQIDANPGPVIDAAPGTPDATPEPKGPDAAPLNPTSDEFNGDSLDSSWNLTRGDLLDISVSGGELHLVPNKYSVWYHEEAGAALWKPLAGNFKITTSVKARSRTNPSQPVGREFQFGGLLAYDPASDSNHNYVFVVVGDRGEYGLQVETKSTIDSRSEVNAFNWPSGDAELRLCRVGSKFVTYMRAIGATSWTEAYSYERSDLPGTLNVGPFAYAYTSEPDLRASFAHVSIEPVSSADDCPVD